MDVGVAAGHTPDSAGGAKRDWIESYRVARDALDEALLSLPALTPVGGWTVIEIAAHVAAWERRAAMLVPVLAAGATAPDVDVDALNGAVSAIARSLPPADTLGAYAESRRVFLAALETAPAGSFGRAPLTDQIVMEREHCLEHAAELRALRRAGTS